MTRTERFGPVVQHVDRKQQKALKEMAHSQQLVAQEKEKLGQLESYRREYSDRGNQANSRYTSVQLQEFNRFLAQLDDTIKRQIDVIRLREKDLALKRANWQKSRVNSNVMHKVVENLQIEEEKLKLRNEQKILDEFSQRRLHRD